VIILTIVDDADKGFALGASDYLTKPFSPQHLAAVLHRHRRDHETGLVLVVEDDLPTRELLRRLLIKEEWGVTEAANGQEALGRLRAGRPDLILLDLMMPEMDGFQLLEELRKHQEWRDIPVIVVTAKDLTPEDRRRLNGYVEHIVQKGMYKRDELLRQVRDLLVTHARRRGRRPQATTA
jgi:CheY-like chemotaxis protein